MKWPKTAGFCTSVKHGCHQMLNILPRVIPTYIMSEAPPPPPMGSNTPGTRLQRGQPAHSIAKWGASSTRGQHRWTDPHGFAVLYVHVPPPLPSSERPSIVLCPFPHPAPVCSVPLPSSKPFRNTS